MAALAMEGIAGSMLTARAWSQPFYGKQNPLDVTACQDTVIDMADAVNASDLGGLEAILTGQVVALNAMFAYLSMQAQKCELAETLEYSMRFALRAQSQCRATVETLATMKSPPMVFAKQANISQGPQQVNNALPAHARAGELLDAPNKLLEASGEPERLDAGTTRQTGESDKDLAPLGTVHRTAKRSR